MLENILYSITNYDYKFSKNLIISKNQIEDIISMINLTSLNHSLLVLEGNLYLCDLKVRTNKLICFGLENFY